MTVHLIIKDMTVHLIKLSVGSETLADLVAWQQQRLALMKREGRPQELIHITRNTPKRAEELLQGGSIYWVIKGWVTGRQKLLEFRPMSRDSIPHCGIVYAPDMVRVQPRAYRAFQGWRYLDAKAAPADVIMGNGGDDIPDAMRRELAELGLV